MRKIKGKCTLKASRLLGWVYQIVWQRLNGYIFYPLFLKFIKTSQAQDDYVILSILHSWHRIPAIIIRSVVLPIQYIATVRADSIFFRPITLPYPSPKFYLCRFAHMLNYNTRRLYVVTYLCI